MGTVLWTTFGRLFATVAAHICYHKEDAMYHPYTLETLARIRQEELLGEARHRRLVEEAIAGGTHSTDRASIYQRARTAVRSLFAIVPVGRIRRASSSPPSTN